MRAFRCGKTVLSILEKYAIKRLNSTEQFKGYCERLLAIKPEIIKEKALKIIENIKGFNVNKGINHMNGKQALAYARERYAYSNGDVHRVQNQQQVLAAVLEKIMSDKSILLKYDSLLNSFSDLYRTDMPRDLIALLVKNQLNDMKSFKIERQYVLGVGSRSETYSMPGVKLYVMNPDMSSVMRVSDKIKEVVG